MQQIDISQASFADRGVTKTLNAFLPALQQICESGVVMQDRRYSTSPVRNSLWFIAHRFVGRHRPCFVHKMQSGGWPYPKGRYKLFSGIASPCSRPSLDMMLISLTLDNGFLVMFKGNRN